eukprot:365235-Pyramimonas_sp.AAC.1
MACPGCGLQPAPLGSPCGVSRDLDRVPHRAPSRPPTRTAQTAPIANHTPAYGRTWDRRTSLENTGPSAGQTEDHSL